MPERLPRRLGDPLRLYRLFLSVGLVLWLAILGLGVFKGVMARPPGERMSYFSLDDDRSTTPLIAIAEVLPWVPGLLWVWLILPRRRTNAFYLRSFRKDERTCPIRQVVQATLGRRFRLSGIRDPGSAGHASSVTSWPACSPSATAHRNS